MGNWVMVPSGVIFPTMSESVLVNHRFPSGPGVMRHGREWRLETKKYEMCPACGVARLPAPAATAVESVPPTSANVVSTAPKARCKRGCRRACAVARTEPVISIPLLPQPVHPVIAPAGGFGQGERHRP